MQIRTYVYPNNKTRQLLIRLSVTETQHVAITHTTNRTIDVTLRADLRQGLIIQPYDQTAQGKTKLHIDKSGVGHLSALGVLIGFDIFFTSLWINVPVILSSNNCLLTAPLAQQMIVEDLEFRRARPRPIKATAQASQATPTTPSQPAQASQASADAEPDVVVPPQFSLRLDDPGGDAARLRQKQIRQAVQILNRALIEDPTFELEVENRLLKGFQTVRLPL